MKKYLYCDSCFLITCFQEGKLNLLSQYKYLFFVAKTQLDCELIRPIGISNAVKKAISVIEEDRDEILIKTNEFAEMYKSLSFFDCLCMAYALLDDYCLVTDDITLHKKCAIHNIEIRASKDIFNKLTKGGDDDEIVRR